MNAGSKKVIIIDADMVPSGGTTLNELNCFIEALGSSAVYDAETVERAVKAISAPVETLEREELEFRQTNLTVTETVSGLLERHKEQTGEAPSAFFRRMIQDHLRYGRPLPQNSNRAAEEDEGAACKRIGLTVQAVDLKTLKQHSLESGESASAFLRRAVYACLS